MEDIIDIIVTETTNLIEIASQPTDEIIDVNIIDNREDVTLNVTPTLVEININSLTGNFGILWGEIEGTLSNQTDLNTALGLKADLVDGKVPSSQLPSYVDDVVEVANYAALPVTGEVGKIYITLDTNYIYRWTGSTYVEIKDSSAVWGAITGTLSNQTDLQNALNAKANDNAVVHLAGTETITGAKTFSSALTAPNFVLSGGTGNTGLYYGHTDRVVLANYTTGGIDFEVNGGSIVATLFPSGNYGLGITLDAGYKLDVNGTTRISGALSGTSASFSSSITASSIIKSGGTSSQFLKADGSVDSNTYLTTSSAASTYISGSGVTDYYARFTGTKVIADGFIRTTSNITYVEGMGLSTGNGLDIQGNYGAGGGGLKIRSYDETTGNAYIDFANTGGRMYLGLNRSTASGLMTNATAYATVLTTGLGTSNLEFGTNATKRMTIDGTTGAVTLTSALRGTSATFSSTNGYLNLDAINSGANEAGLFLKMGGTNVWEMYTAANDDALNFWRAGGGIKFKIATSGAATFSSSVTATSYSIAANGTIASNPFWGTLHYKGTGSYADWSLINSAGNGIMWNPTGTLNMVFNGNVGIGTTSPASKLHIEGTGTGAWLTINRTDSGTNLVDYTQSGTRLGYIGYIGSELWINNATASDISIRTNGSERMRITSSGSVGIGTSSPLSPLHLVGSTNGAVQLYIHNVNGATNSSAELVFGTWGGAIPTGSGNPGPSAKIVALNALSNDARTDLAFHTYASTGTSAERMRIKSSGSVAITSSSNDSGGRRFYGYDGGTGNQNGLGLDMSGNSYEYSQFFAYGTSDNGRMTAGSYDGTTYRTKFILYGNGNYSFSGSNVSDIRLKQDINKLESNSIEKLSALTPKSYYMKDNTELIRYGFIAQEVKEIIPDLINGVESEDSYLGIDYNGLTTLLVKAVQELKAELDTLKNK